MQTRFVAVVPVKPPVVGKSRLRTPTADERRTLAGAFALDTVTACLRTPAVAQVLVATDDAAFARSFDALGCTTVPDGDTNDLNSALRQAAAEAHRRWPDLVPVAICADLPALVPDDLTAALAQVEPGRTAFVVDAHGTGTSLFVAPHATFRPRFGVESARAHRMLGAYEITGELRTLRHDVDDLADLDIARELGLGEHTARAVAQRPRLSS